MTETMDIKVERDSWGRLVVAFGDGQSHVGVEPVRCFPLSDPNRAIALLDADGHELITLPSLDLLSPPARALVESELASRDFIPVIRRIISATHPLPPCIWAVETDRGETRFQIESEDDIRKLGPKRIMIADSHGIRYSIPNIQQLDAASQRIVIRLV